MKTFSTFAKRVLIASSLTLLAACGSNGPTDPTAARKSGYLTVSATVNSSGYNVPATITPAAVSATATTRVPIKSTSTITTGYNVPAN